MASAYYAKKNNLPFKVYEKSNYVGGNCRTLEYENFRFDTGAHRFHDKIPKVTSVIKKLLNEDLIQVTSPSKIFLNDEFIHFPIRILDILKNININSSLQIIREIIKIQFNKVNQDISFKDFAYNKYGETLSELLLINYTEKLWGQSADMLSPSISGGRLKNLNMLSTLKELFLNTKFKSKHLDGSFYYPRRGYGSIFDSIHTIIGNDNICFNSQIVKICHDEKKINNIVLKNNETIYSNEIISTLPLNTLIKLLDPLPCQHILDIINNLKFRALRLCVIFINKSSFTPNASLYFPDSKVSFTRIYEPKNRSLSMAPSDKTSIVVEIPYDQDDIIEDDDNQMYTERIISELISKRLLNKKDIISTKLFNIPYAYPVIEKGIDSKLELVFNYLRQFKNLHIIGRSAEFKYLHTHDLFDSADKKIQYLLNRGKING